VSCHPLQVLRRDNRPKPKSHRYYSIPIGDPNKTASGTGDKTASGTGDKTASGTGDKTARQRRLVDANPASIGSLVFAVEAEAEAPRGRTLWFALRSAITR
jgi:hypothetical protein